MSTRTNGQGYCVAELTDAEKCTGCRNCSDMCPDSAIKVVQTGAVDVFGSGVLVKKNASGVLS